MALPYGAVEGVGDGGLNAGGSFGAGLGGIMSSLGSLGAAFAPDRSKEKRFNNNLDRNSSFLAQGGGQRNAAAAKKSAYWNGLMMDSPMGDFIRENRPDMMTAMNAEEGRGPGGGLGIYTDANQYAKENKLDYEDEGPGKLARILGAVGAIGGMIPGLG